MCYVSIISNEILKYSIHHEYTNPDVYVSHSCTGTLELSFSQTGGAYVPGEKKLYLVNSEKVKVMRPVFVNVKCWQRIWKSKPVSHYTHTCIWLIFFKNIRVPVEQNLFIHDTYEVLWKLFSSYSRNHPAYFIFVFHMCKCLKFNNAKLRMNSVPLFTIYCVKA